jgi:hypothetical protein
MSRTPSPTVKDAPEAARARPETAAPPSPPRQRPILCSNDAATGLDMPSGPPAA